jgi:hypothetical protein
MASLRHFFALVEERLATRSMNWIAGSTRADGNQLRKPRKQQLKPR